MINTRALRRRAGWQAWQTTLVMLIGLSCCTVSIGFAAEDMPFLAVHDVKRDPVAALKAYVPNVTLGTVYGPAARMRLRGAELDAANRELPRVHNICRSLANLLVGCADNALTREDTIAVMQQLIRLRREVQKNETLGVGNLQLSYALSLMMSGLFFQINEPRDAGDDALWAIVREHDRSRVRDVLVSALATETGVDRGDDIRPLYEILMMDYARVHRQDADNRLGDLHLLHRTLTAPGVAFRGHLGDQLYEFNAAWFTWDVVNAARLLAMCKLSLLVERAARANDTLRVHERFEKAVAVLDPLERQSLWATVPPGLGPTERNLAVWTDIRIQSAAKGRPILGLVRGRLDAQRGNEVLR